MLNSGLPVNFSRRTSALRRPARRVKVRFRAALLSLVAMLVVSTVAVVGVCSYVGARDAAQDLAKQVLDQTSLRVDQEVGRLLAEATEPTDVTVRLLNAGVLDARDFPRLVGFWRQVMAAHPGVSSLFLGLNDNGECVGVSRLQGRLSVWQSKLGDTGANGVRAINEYWAEDYPARPYHTDPAGGPDIRARPWFIAARDAAGPTWTDTYVFLGVAARKDVFGVTHAAAVRRAGDGSLDAVVSADFGVDQLSHFLKSVRVGRSGFAFIVETHADGKRHVIAHPAPEILRSAKSSGSPRGPVTAPVTAEELDDEQAVALLATLPRDAGAPGGPSSGNVRFTAGGQQFLGSYRRVTGDRAPHWVICAVLPEQDVLANAQRDSRRTVLITLAALAVALLMAMVLGRAVARPLEYLAQDAAAVGHLRVEARPPVRSFVAEVDRLAVASEEMKAGLRSFQKYVPLDLVRGLLDSGQEAKLGGERRTVTIYFSDIKDFTATSESLTPEQLVAQLGDYLGAVTDCITAAGGTVDKFIGDAVMAFWGAPDPRPDHAAAAVRAAWLCQQRLAALRAGPWPTLRHAPFHTRIGVHTGEVIVGNIGSTARMNYTVIGDAVNLASRLEGLNKHYGTAVLITAETLNATRGAVTARPLDYVSVKGRTAPVLVYEVLGLPDQTDPATLALAATYAAALDHYRHQRWPDALRAFTEALALRPDDQPSLQMIDRCRHYLQTPPPTDWDGVHRMTEK